MLKRVVLFILLSLFGVESASALPIFARRYQTSCTTCHAIIPKLNPFGIAFRNNGYRIPVNDAAFVQVQDLSLGAPAWKQLWPKAVWPGAIQGIPPIAIRVNADAEVRPSEKVNLNFNFPNFLGLYFAGPAGDTFSFFGSVLLFGATNTIVLDRAYGQFRLLPEKPGSNLLNLKVGRIDTRAEPFSSTYRRPTIIGFNVNESRSLSDAFAFREHDAGIELWGAATGPHGRGGLQYGVGVVQGTAGRAENNNSKDFYWAGSYKFGGLGVAGSTQKQESLGGDRNYAEWSLEAGIFGYRGKRPTTAVGVAENQFTRNGVKFDAYLSKLNLYGAAVSGHENIRNSAGSLVKTSGGFIEADYMLLPWVMPLMRYERTRLSGGKPVRALVTGVNLAIRANVRTVIEGHFYNTDGTAPIPFGATTGAKPANEGMVRLEFLF